jgi:hypothetical protein
MHEGQRHMSQQVIKVTWVDAFKVIRTRYATRLAAFFGAPADSLSDVQIALWIYCAGQ